jgi:hypothetical protein
MSTIPAWAKVHQYLETTDYHFKSGHFYASPTSRKILDDEVLAEVMKELKTYLDKTDFLSAVGKKQASEKANQLEDLTLFGDAKELVEAFIKAKDIIARGRGDMLQIGKHSSNLEDILVKLRVYAQEYNASIPKDDNNKPLGINFNPKYVEDVFIDLLIDKDHQYKDETNEKLKHDGTDADLQVKELLGILNIETDLDLSCAVVKHWLWLVKRRLLDRTVNDELMVALMSAQGVGKSFITRKLAEPLGDYYAEADLTSLADTREVSKWSRYYIINFEELSKSGGAQANGHFTPKTAEAVKKVLTQEDFVTRAMRSHKQFRHKRTFTAWATTNVSIVEVLGDETGMRRFFEIVSKQEAGVQFDHDRVGKYSFLALWKAIDEDLERGYLYSGSEHWTQLQEVQKTYIPKSQIDLFMSDGPLKPADDMSDARHALSPLELYQHFKDFCEEAGYKSSYVMSFKKFKSRIPPTIPHKGETYYLDEKEGV